MCDHLFVGMTIYHKTGKTKAVIIWIDQKNIMIKLSKELALKEKLTLPITHIGEWLFFDESDVDLDASTLANRPEYLKYKNQKLLDASNKIFGQNIKTLGLNEQKKTEIQKQRSLFDKSGVNLDANTLANRPEYLKYKNQKLFDAYNKIVEQKKKILELNEQKTAEIQEQREIEKKIKCEIRLKTEFIDFSKVGAEDNRIEEIYEYELLNDNPEITSIESSHLKQKIYNNPLSKASSYKNGIEVNTKNENEVKEILKKRKIPYLVHFTRIDNLNSILKNGLVPVCLQQMKNILSIHNDEQRIDAQLDCTSCSVGFPNYKLFYAFRESKYPGTKWVTIVIDTDILFSQTNIKYYCYTNASAVFPKTTYIKELCEANSFETMFCELLKTKDNKTINRTSLQIDDYLTTDPQAEILISNVIEPKYIKGICFQKQNDIEDFIKTNGSTLISQYKYRVFTVYFDKRKDYMFWKKE